MLYEMWRFVLVPAQGVKTWCYVVYTVLYVFLSSVIGLCCKIIL